MDTLIFNPIESWYEFQVQLERFSSFAGGNQLPRCDMSISLKWKFPVRVFPLDTWPQLCFEVDLGLKHILIIWCAHVVFFTRSLSFLQHFACSSVETNKLCSVSAAPFFTPLRRWSHSVMRVVLSLLLWTKQKRLENKLLVLSAGGAELSAWTAKESAIVARLLAHRWKSKKSAKVKIRSKFSFTFLTRTQLLRASFLSLGAHREQNVLSLKSWQHLGFEARHALENSFRAKVAAAWSGSISTHNDERSHHLAYGTQSVPPHGNARLAIKWISASPRKIRGAAQL